MRNECFSNLNFTRNLMKAHFHKHRAFRTTLEIVHHFLIDPSNENEKDLNNASPSSDENQDTCSYEFIESNEVIKLS